MSAPDSAGLALEASTERPAPAPSRARPSRRLSPPVVAVVALTLGGFVLRVVVAGQSLFGDELSTYWIVEDHGLHGVLSLLYGSAPIHHAEITPPLVFVLAWFTSRLGHAALWLRAPSLIAGTLTLPVIYALGRRLADTRIALVATALAMLSPFMLFYSTEARAYGVLMFLVTLATLAMLLAIDTGRRRWWALYAACSCAAVYTHFTGAFVLIVQFAWLWWAHPEARRPAVVANAAAVLGLLPWISGFLNDFNSPTVAILSALSPFNLHQIPVILGHWALGYPYANSAPLSALPGTVALVLVGLAAALAVVGLAVSGREAGQSIVPERWPRVGHVDRRVVLLVLLAVATPIGEALVSTVSTHLFGVRNLAASWPPAGILCAAVLMAGTRFVRLAAVAVALVGFAIAAERMLTPAYERPQYGAAAAYIDHHAVRGDVVIDETGDISPGPLTPLGIALHAPVRVFRAGAPAERTHPFGYSDPVVPLSSAVAGALAAARGAPIFVVSTGLDRSGIAELDARIRVRAVRLTAHYRLVGNRVYPGIARVQVEMFAARTPGA